MRTTLAAAAGAVAAWYCPGANAATVDAGAVTTVTVDAPLYDPNLSSANGCDPAGCVGDLTRDGDLATQQSRWSCKPALGTTGSTCSITYNLGESLTLEGIKIAMYKGNERTRTMGIYVDGLETTTWTSSGTTTGFETVDIGVAGETVELRGVLADSEWLSIMEVELLVDDGIDSTTVEAGTLGTVTTTAALYDTNVASSNGCDPAGCTAALTRDGLATDGSRWSCAPKLGGTCTISYDLGAVRDLSELLLALYKGDERTRTMEIYVDSELITTWTSSGTEAGFESIDLSGTSGQTIEVTGVLTNSEWLSIKETEIMVLSDGVTPPSPTPVPPTAPPVSTPTGDLATVGLLPLARGPGSDEDAYWIKDGDFSTSWTCTGGPRDPDPEYIVYDCTFFFDLLFYRHIKQVKIALPDGAARAVDMRIFSRWNSEVTEEFITSSGTTDGLETYDYDYRTNRIWVSAVFVTEGESISISEIEFVEELQSGQVSVASFSGPSDNGDGLWNPATENPFEWSSDSDEAIDRTLYFVLGTYATVSSIDLQFPVGDTYLFDLVLFNDADGTDESFKTITGLESTDMAGWQVFDLGLDADQIVTDISIVIKGTGSGAPGFYLSDARVMGSEVDNPTNEYHVGSTYIDSWTTQRYPDFVAEGTGDQKAIMEAICALKKASFDGVDCVGEDPTATGTVRMAMGTWRVDGNIFVKSGVYLRGSSALDDSLSTDIILEEGAAGNTAIDSIVVIDGVSDVIIEEFWIYGQYDLETSNDIPAVEGLGSTGVSITNSQNITCNDLWVNDFDGDAIVVRESNMVNIDAGRFDDEYVAWQIAKTRGTGLVVDGCDSVWVRRHGMFDNAVAGIHIIGSNNFTFEATIGTNYGYTEGEGYVGSLDGQQPIDVIVESSSLVTFQDMRVRSTNDPAMTISADSSAVSFINLGLSSVPTGNCVIQTVDPSVVAVEDDELDLVGTCYVKV